MSMPSYENARWKLVGWDIHAGATWEDGVQYHQKEISADLEKECDPYSAALRSRALMAADMTITDKEVEVPVSGGNSTPRTLILTGTWNITRFSVKYNDKMASVFMSIYVASKNKVEVNVPNDETAEEA